MKKEGYSVSRFLLNILLLLFFSTNSAFSQTTQKDAQPTSKDCSAAMEERRREFGEPEEIKNYTLYDGYYNGSDWLYSVQEVKFIFKWGGSFEKCYIEREHISTLTEKGKQLIMAELKKRYMTWNDKSYGFMNIPFGMHYEDVAKMMKVNGLTGYDHGKINNFDLGGKGILVTFDFDNKQRFYTFSFQTSRYSANYFDTTIQTDVAYLDDVFRNKYGKPTKCSNVKFLFVRQGYITYKCQWTKPNAEIYTGITSYDSEYFTVAVVTDKKLQKEYEQYLKSLDAKGAAAGAKKF